MNIAHIRFRQGGLSPHLCSILDVLSCPFPSPLLLVVGFKLVWASAFCLSVPSPLGQLAGNGLGSYHCVMAMLLNGFLLFQKDVLLLYHVTVNKISFWQSMEHLKNKKRHREPLIAAFCFENQGLRHRIWLFHLTSPFTKPMKICILNFTTFRRHFKTLTPPKQKCFWNPKGSLWRKSLPPHSA